VLDVIVRLQAALVCDYVLLGGGNAKLMKNLPSHVIMGANSNAVEGGLRLWQNPDELRTSARPVKPVVSKALPK
jgi:polyphosphate glucokinase